MIAPGSNASGRANLANDGCNDARGRFMFALVDDFCDDLVTKLQSFSKRPGNRHSARVNNESEA